MKHRKIITAKLSYEVWTTYFFSQGSLILLWSFIMIRSCQLCGFEAAKLVDLSKEMFVARLDLRFGHRERVSYVFEERSSLLCGY